MALARPTPIEFMNQIPNDVFVIISTVGGLGSSAPIGTPGYSYAFLVARLVKTLERAGIHYRVVDLPEYFGHPASFVDEFGESLAGRPIVHLCVRPFDQLRVIRGTYNIACVAWEWPTLNRDAKPSDTIFQVPVAMLNRFDEVWATSDYGASVLREHDVANVQTMTAPFFPSDEHVVSLNHAMGVIGSKLCVPFLHNFAVIHNINASMARKRARSLAELIKGGKFSRVVVSVLNPGDPRKNLANMMTGFTYFAQQHPDWLYLLKASQGGLDAVTIASEAISAKLPGIGQFDMPNVYVLSDYLDDDELDALYSIADFYLVAAFAEGQNLPLQEAMARGVVPITTINTAMAEYVTEHAVTIHERTTSNLIPNLAHSAAGTTVPWMSYADERAITAALETAAALTQERYAELSSGAREAIRQALPTEEGGARLVARLREMARVPA